MSISPVLDIYSVNIAKIMSNSISVPILINRNESKETVKTLGLLAFVELNAQINGKQMDLRLLVTGLGKQRIILGFPWLHEYNPEINWKTGDFTW